jgi:D-alanine transaminase
VADPLAIAWLNGEFLPLRDARVPALDRGFLFGDGVYEVAPVYGGRIFRFREHIARLDRSLHEIRMAPVYTLQRWAEVLQELVKRNGGGDMYVYAQVTRGTQFGRHHAPLPDIERTVFCFAAPPPDIPAERFARGAPAITTDDIRWARCDIKTTSLLANVLLKQLAMDAGATEVLMLRDGLLMEGATTTAHVVIKGEIRTPPRSNRILPGCTRDVVGELADRAGIPFRMCAIAEAELRGADELFIAASTFGTMPIVQLDGKPVGRGVVGPMWKRVHGLFEDYKRELAGTPIL